MLALRMARGLFLTEIIYFIYWRWLRQNRLYPDQSCMYPNRCLFVCGAIQPRRDCRYLRVNCLALQKAVAPRGPSGTETAYICINRDYDKEAWHIITLLRVWGSVNMGVCIRGCAHVHVARFWFTFSWRGLSQPGRERADQIFMEVTNGKAFQQRWGGGGDHASDGGLNHRN